jgi:hypothetical protein
MAVELHSAGAPTDGDRLIGTLGDWQPGIGTFPDGVVDGRAEGGLRSDKSCYRSGREYRWFAKLPYRLSSLRKTVMSSWSKRVAPRPTSQRSS